MYACKGLGALPNTKICGGGCRGEMYAYGGSAAIRHNGNCIPYMGMLIVFQLIIAV